MIFKNIFCKYITAAFLVSFWLTTSVLAYCIFDEIEPIENTHESDQIQHKNPFKASSFQNCVDQCSEHPACDFLEQSKALRTPKSPLRNLRISRKISPEPMFSGELIQSKLNLDTQYFDFKTQQSLFAQKTSLLIYH